MTAAQADKYLSERTGSFEQRAVRYRAALEELQLRGLRDDDTIFDIGAGFTELDVVLRVDGGWRGRYIPIDLGIDPDRHDLAAWTPPRPARFAVALEVLEHLDDPWALIERLKNVVDVIIVSVPNPETVDVLGIDDTHKTILTADELESAGFAVWEETFYGGVYSGGEDDALFAVWARAGRAMPHYHRGSKVIVNSGYFRDFTGTVLSTKGSRCTVEVDGGLRFECEALAVRPAEGEGADLPPLAREFSWTCRVLDVDDDNIIAAEVMPDPATPGAPIIADIKASLFGLGRTIQRDDLFTMTSMYTRRHPDAEEVRQDTFALIERRPWTVEELAALRAEPRTSEV